MVIPIVVVIALVIILAQAVNIMGRECSKNKDCDNDEYCGSDFKCHKYPTINQNNFIPAAAIVAAGLIGAALILRWKKKDNS